MHVLIGAAWPYASGPRHLGHLAGAYLPADVIARAGRLLGHDVLFVSGSDEHGTPITVAAERAGRTPAAHAAEQHERIAAELASVGVSFDHYGRTTSPVHRRTVQDVFARLYAAGAIDEAEQLAAWCPGEGRSLPDRYVEGTCPSCGAADARGDQCDECGRSLDPDELVAPRCRVCGGGAQLRPQRQLLLRLDRLQHAVGAWLEASSARWTRPWAADEARGALRDGLRARAITRDLRWGVDVPLDGWGDRVLYVWFDAVIGYLSASVEARPDDWQAWWCDGSDDGGDGGRGDPRHRYVVGKDNVWFHALWWPAILHGAGGGLHLPDDVVASHFLTEAGAQLSASRGHGTTIAEAVERVGVDALRHALVALSPETADVELTWEQVDDATRTGLLGSIANPAHRVATLLARRFDGRVHGDTWRSTAADEARADATAATRDALHAFHDDAAVRRGLALVHDAGRTVNRRLAATEPWAAPDDVAHRELTLLVPWLDAIAVAAWPVVPDVADRIRAALGRAPITASSTAALPVEEPRVPPTPAPPFRVR
jgi:methionyl-tRNA synthetase